MKFSKDLLELRDKEAKLVRMKRYEEAEKVKMKADLLEEFERNKLEAEVSITPSIAIKRQPLKPHFDLINKHHLFLPYEISLKSDAC